MSRTRWVARAGRGVLTCGNARVDRVLLALVGSTCVLTFALTAWARPGGGQTFGSGDDGSSGGGDGGGGGGGGELIYLLLRLVFAYPKLGIPLLLVALYIWWKMQQAQPESWTSSHVSARPAVTRSQQAPLALDTLQHLDPDFSRIVFDDFCYRLYASAYLARADQSALAALAPYLSAQVREELASEPPRGLAGSQVVVGSMRITNLELVPETHAKPSHVRLALNYEANVSFGAQTTYRRERWVLERAASARTKPPEETARLGCPNCGAPFSSSDGRRCAYCDQVVEDGRFAWQVVQRHVLSVEARPPALTSDVKEAGTHRPTVRAPSVTSELAALKARDPAVDENTLEARVQYLYRELNRAWSGGDLPALRGLTSDGMFDYLRYWIDAYRAQDLHNALENMRIARVEIAKVVHDKHFDAVTMRLWASGRDFTRNVTTGQIVSGSQQHERAYSEYWTLIRGATTRGKSHNQGTCPSCAAPLTISMAGACSHCGSHLTRGEFDWVLSKIEQDDVYEG